MCNIKMTYVSFEPVIYSSAVRHVNHYTKELAEGDRHRGKLSISYSHTRLVLAGTI